MHAPQYPGGHSTLFSPALIITLVFALLGCEAQQVARVARVGMLQPNPAPSGPLPPAMQARWTAFTQELSRLGYREGQNLVIERRYAAGRDDLLRQYAAELVQLKVDVIFAVSSSALRASRDATRTIPIVALDLESDPIQTGVVASLARPGGNVTGVFLDMPEFNGKRVALLKEIVPRLRRLAVLWDAGTDPGPVRATEAAAQSLGIRLQVLQVRSPTDFDGAFVAATKGGAGALMVLQAPVTDRYGAEIAQRAERHRLPATAMFREFAEAGGLMSYGPNLNELFGRVGVYVGKILKGAHPRDLPVERPARFDLVINLKTAKALGLSIPESVGRRANELIP